jgi:hypothetical protein
MIAMLLDTSLTIKPKTGTKTGSGRKTKLLPNPLSARVQKEFQCLVSVVAMDIIHDAHHSCMTLKQQREWMYLLVHGKNDNASQLKLLIEGAQFYKRLFNNVVTDVVSTDATSNSNMVLKNIFNPVRGDNCNDLVVGKQITVEFIQCATRNGDCLIGACVRFLPLRFSPLLY